MKFRLMHGAHVQANPDGLDGMALKDLKTKAVTAGMDKDDARLESAQAIVAFLRKPMFDKHKDRKWTGGGSLREDGSIGYHAIPGQARPTFEENNEAAIAVILQDTEKYQRADATPEQVTGITDEQLMAELHKRGLTTIEAPAAGAGDVAEVDERLNRLEQLSNRELQQVVADHEIDITDDAGQPLTRKADIITAIRNAQMAARAG